MRILTGTKWKTGFLDYHKNRTEYRIRVLAWKNLEKLENVYHTRAKSIRLLLNYFPVVGFEGLRTKVWSRLREENRNKKFVSCGVGEIMETADGGSPVVSGAEPFKQGDIVGFVAPLHPAVVERVTLPEELVFKLDVVPELLHGQISYFPLRSIPEIEQGVRFRESNTAWWKHIRGWSIYSGAAISPETCRELKAGLLQELEATDWKSGNALPLAGARPVSETMGPGGRNNPRKKRGIVFGFGNYAKINVIPYCRPFIDITTVHEIDPTQMYPERRIKRWDAAPFPRPDERYDVYFVASYNHTHVPITLHALRQGAYALVEKPVANDYDELAELERTLRQVGRKVFVGFHKRYGAFNKFALRDLGVKYGEPISYHSVVYELEQPEFFWYNWPVSRSTFFANGCHQVDHFLHLNNFSKPVNFDIRLLQDHAVLVWIELENGATFTTVFSEKGSLRVGPRDHVELKVPGRDVRIEDNVRYMSEDNSRIIRKLRVYKTHSYKTMYREIGRKIAHDEDGDSLESLFISTKLMLDLEAKLTELKHWRNRYEDAKKNFWNYFGQI